MPLVVSTPKRRVLFAGLYSGLTCGCFYGFGIYSPALKQQFGLSQSELMNINTIPYAFGVFSFAWGYITKTCGPGFAMLFGGSMMALSQLFTYLLATKVLVLPELLPPPLTLVGSACVTFWGMQLVSSAAFTAPIQHFQQNRGDVASIVKSFVGAGGGITTQIFVVIWGTPKGDVTALNALLLWATLSICLNFIGWAFVPHAVDHAAATPEPRRVLSHVFNVIVLLGLTATLSSMVPPLSLTHSSLVLALLLLFLSPVSAEGI